MCAHTLQVEEEMRHKQDLLAACGAKEQTLQDQVHVCEANPKSETESRRIDTRGPRAVRCGSSTSPPRVKGLQG
jgi:hypothetical protein